MRLARYSIFFSILRSKIRNLRMCRGQKVKDKVEVAAKSSRFRMKRERLTTLRSTMFDIAGVLSRAVE